MNDPCADTPFVWTAGRGGFKRLVAHVLIRLLILMPLPPQFQLAAAFFPVSLLWPFMASAEPARNGEKELPEGLAPDNVAPLSERPGGTCGSVSPAVQVTRTDILISGTTAIVATNTGTAYLISLVDPVHPTLIGTIQGVGSKIVLTEAGILLSTARSYIENGNDPLRGLHSTAMMTGSFVTRVEPTPIVLAASNEVFKDVQLDYRVVPPLAGAAQAEVQIDVVGGGRVATLPGALDAQARGSVTWPAGAVVNPARSYEARAEVQQDGQPLPSFRKRLVFERLPLAAIVKDRLLRVQVALPEQNLFEGENRYKVEVYVADAADQFPETASFSVGTSEMSAAPPNLEESWPSTSESPEATKLWFTRKLDRMQLPPGTSTQIRRQAFEIATVLGRYAQVRIVVKSEVDGRELRREDARVTPDPSFAELLTALNVDIRRSAGEPFAPGAAHAMAATTFGDALERLGGLTARALLYCNDLNNRFSGNVLLGVWDGFKETLEGDIETVVFLKTAFTQNPLVTAQAIGSFFKELWAALPDQATLVGTVATLIEKADPFNPRPSEALLMAAENGGYYAGYLIGLVLEQALTTALIAAGLAAATAKAGAVGGALAGPARQALSMIRVPIWLTQVARRVAVLIRAVCYMLQGLARIARFVKEYAGAALRFALEHRAKLDALFTKYQKIDRLLEMLSSVMVVSREAAGRALHWLTIVDRMAEEAGVRFGKWFANRGADMGEAWLTRWAQMTNGKRAVKDAFEAHTALEAAPEGVAHALVAGANLPHPNPATNYAKEYLGKYGVHADDTLARLKLDLADGRYTDEVIGRTVRAHADAAFAAGVGGEAVEGSARLIRDGIGELTSDQVEELLKGLLRESRADSDTLLGMLLASGSPAEVQGFAKAMSGIPCVVVP